MPLLPQPSQKTTLTGESSGGYGFDDDSQQQKRPPWLPFQTSDAYSLIALPTLKLSEELKDFLPGTQLYYDLLNQLGYGEDINIILQIDGHQPVSIPVHRSERAELAEHMTSAQALLSWLAPKLNGREELVDWLLDIQTHVGGDDTGLEKEFLEAVEKQLAMVLEQRDSEFNLEFERDWLSSQAQRESHPDTKPDTSVVHDDKEISKLFQQGMYGQGSGSTRSLSGQSSGTSSSSSSSSTATGFGNSGGNAQRQQPDNNNRQEGAVGGATEAPESGVTITFVGNSDSGKSSLANLLLGFAHFEEREVGIEGLEPDYNHNGVRIRALPGYKRGLSRRYPRQFEIGRDDIVFFVLKDDPEDKDMALLRNIISSRGFKQDRIIIVRNKSDGLLPRVARRSDEEGTSFKESLRISQDTIKGVIKDDLKRAGLSEEIPIIFTSADPKMVSWSDIKELYGNINRILDDTTQSWNRFSSEFNEIERTIDRAVTLNRRGSGILSDNISRIFRMFSFSQESVARLKKAIERAIRQSEELHRNSGGGIDIDSLLAQITTGLVLNDQRSGNAAEGRVAQTSDEWCTTRRYNDGLGNAETLVWLGTEIAVKYLHVNRVIAITVGRAIIAFLHLTNDPENAQPSYLRGQESTVTLNEHDRERLLSLRDSGNRERFSTEAFDVVAKTMAYVKFTEAREKLSRNHSCPECPPKVRSLPPMPWISPQDFELCRLQ